MLPRYLTLNVTTNGSVFSGENRDQEVANIIRKAVLRRAYRMTGGSLLYDSSGACVGLIRLDCELTPPNANFVKKGSVSLCICVDGAAFDGDNCFSEIDRLLRITEECIALHRHDFELRNTNNAVIGWFASRHDGAPLQTIHGINMADALAIPGRVRVAHDGFDSIADGGYRLVVDGSEFTVDCQTALTDVWLVNAKGEIAPGYEKLKTISALDFRKLYPEELSRLLNVVEGRLSFDDYEKTYKDVSIKQGA